MLKLCRDVEAEESARVPRVSLPNEPFDLSVVPAALTLRDYILRQTVGNIYRLVTIMYLGRGDFTASDFREQYQYSQDCAFPAPINAVNQMLTKGLLARYLIDGVAAMRRELTKHDSIDLVAMD